MDGVYTSAYTLHKLRGSNSYALGAISRFRLKSHSQFFLTPREDFTETSRMPVVLQHRRHLLAHMMYIMYISKLKHLQLANYN